MILDPRAIPDNLSVEKVFMGGTVEPALFRGYIGQIADPDLVRRCCLKVLFQEIFRHGECMLRIRRGLELLDLLAAYPELLPDPSDPKDTHFDAVGGKILLQSFRSASLSRSPVGSRYLRFEAAFFLRPFRRRTLKPCIVAAS